MLNIESFGLQIAFCGEIQIVCAKPQYAAYKDKFQ
jgi:hypothetical protein